MRSVQHIGKQQNSPLFSDVFLVVRTSKGKKLARHMPVEIAVWHLLKVFVPFIAWAEAERRARHEMREKQRDSE